MKNIVSHSLAVIATLFFIAGWKLLEASQLGNSFGCMVLSGSFLLAAFITKITD